MTTVQNEAILEDVERLELHHDFHYQLLSEVRMLTDGMAEVSRAERGTGSLPDFLL
ncbi:MAG TPA: hypothetical protein VGT03_14190 [Candidatus Acidoferrales bacterium]|nr:hypothetical protein [Candidatus Acidoferrales bacterium]